MKDPQVTVRGKAALDAELAKAERAKQQEGEDAMAEVLDSMEILYLRQYPYAEGRKLRADFAILSGELLIEIVGGVWQRKAHGSVTGVLTDIDRLNEATLNGFKMLRFTPDQVRDGTARTTLERLLE